MVIISTKDKPIWQIVLAALFFTIAIFLLISFFYFFQYNSFEDLIKDITSLLFTVLIFVFGGISFSQKRTMFFDLEKKKFKDQFSIGSLKIGRWQDLPPLNYISVFGVDSKYSFTINLWYDRNKYINIFAIWGREKAFETAFEIASQLNIKLLDATKRNNYKYLDMDELKEKYKE